MKFRSNVLGWIATILAVVGIVAILAAKVSKWVVLAPIAILVVGVVLLLKGVKYTGKAINWVLTSAWALATLALIATILVAIFFGWLALLPFTVLCAVCIWLVYLLKKTVLWIPILALVIALVLLGMYAIMGSLMKDWNKAIDTLTVETLIVEGDQTVKGDQTVEGNQTVKGDQTVEGNSTVKGDQTVEGNQTVKGDQTVEGNQTVKGDQTVEGNSTVKGDQTVEGNSTVEGDLNVKGDINVDGNINDNTPSAPSGGTGGDAPSQDDTTPSEPAHTHSYASKTVAPTCTAQGYTEYTCSCGHSYKDNYKDALGHDYKSKVVAPTETSKGYTEHTCTRCGHSYKDAYTDKLTPAVKPAIKCNSTIRYGETLYVTLEGIQASNLLVSNKNFVSVEIISDSRVAITLTEEVDGYITITDSASRTNVVIDIVA